MLKQSSGRQSLTDLLLWNLEPSFGCQGRCTSESETILPDLVGTQAELNRKTHWRDITISMACSMTLPCYNNALLWRLQCEAFACAQVFCSLVRCHKHHTLCLLSHLRTATSMWSWIELKRFMTALFPARFDLQGSTSRQSSKKRLGKKMSKWPLHPLHRHYTLQLPFAKLETDFEMPGQLANQEVAPKRPSLRISFWQKSLLAMASSCGSFQDLWFVAAQHLNANILSQDGCGEPEHNLFGSLSFFWSLGRWIRRGAQRFSALKIPGLTSSPWWPWWRLRVI